MTIKKKLANTKETFKGTMKLALCLDAFHFVCYPTVALWLQKPSKNKIICKNNRKIVLEIVTVEEENYEKPCAT
ncbi:MAG: hypothetical protein E7258_09310 [Lachnospiraceae bacterium]|nr:hypothetical protein [Lachnospiraceae bacterium]